MNTITFLGTAGARFVVARQLRASGGLWCSFEGKNILIDPGPGSLLRCHGSEPKLDPAHLDAIILTHKHLDHSNDINIMIEAMTDGGYKKRGVVFCPQDALKQDPVILEYIRSHPEKIEILKERKEYTLGNLQFTAPVKQVHGVETYGLKFFLNSGTVSLIADTRFFPEMIQAYSADILIINVVFFEPREEFDHLSLDDAKSIIQEIRPKHAILTHFGINMLKAKPYEQAHILSEEIGLPVQSAYDGITLNMDTLLSRISD